MVSWFHVKAEQCGRMAKDAVDPRQRSHFEAERELWFQIADSQRHQEERRNDERLNAGAFAPDPSRLLAAVRIRAKMAKNLTDG